MSLLVGLALATTPPVVAQDDPNYDAEEEAAPPGSSYLLLPMMIIGTGGLVAIVGNALPIASDEQPSEAWRTTAWIFGVPGVLLSSLVILEGAFNEDLAGYTIGGAFAAIAITDIVLAIAGANQPSSGDVSLLPSVQMTVAGRPVLGLDLRIRSH